MTVITIDVAAQLGRMSLQRWSFSFAAVVAAPAAPIATSTAAGSGHSPFVLALVMGLAIASCAQPDSHVAVAVPVVAVWHWIASIGASTSGWTIVVALCLFVFHTIVALMATTPARGTIDRRSLSRWLRRTLAVVLATVGVWLLVLLVEQRQLAGSALVTATGLVVAISLLVAVVAPRRSKPSTR
jgi:hypothetical protein